MYTVDVPLWIETEGAVQHVKDYIIHYKISPPSASSSSSTNDHDSDEDTDEDNDANEADKDGSNDPKHSRKRNCDRKEDAEEHTFVVESDLEMFIGMYETAIEMAAADDAKKG